MLDRDLALLFFIGIYLFFAFVPSPGNAGFIERKAEGWHFYESIVKPEPKKEEEKNEETVVKGAAEQLEDFKKELDRLKAVAIMQPSYENVKAYMKIQKELVDKSSRFASRWQEVIYTTPSLDYTVQHPTSQAGRHVYLAEKKKNMDLEVQSLSQTHGLFFFFSGSCAYCKKFAPIVLDFAQRYGWGVIAVSTDGSRLPEFPDAVDDNGIASKLGVEFVPSLFAVNPESQEVIPLSHGFSSQDQILDRIRVLIIERKNQ